MKTKIIFFIFQLTFIATTSLYSQQITCDQITLDDVFCNFSDLIELTGTMTADNSPGNQPNPLCPTGGAAHNITWIAFVPPAGNYEIEITFNSCTIDPQMGTDPGVQVGIYTDCTFSEAILCDPTCSTAPVKISSSILEPGFTYYLFIDGCHNSVCEYEFSVSGTYEVGSALTGNTFIDYNADGIKNGIEPALENVIVSLEGEDMMTLTNEDGIFSFDNIPSGTYTLTATESEGNWEEDVITKEIEYTQSCEHYSIGFVPAPSTVPDALVNVTNTIARCDRETDFYIYIQNTSIVAYEGSFEFVFDDLTTYVSSDIPDISVNGNVAMASTGILQPLEGKNYIITLKMPPVSVTLPELDFAITVFDDAQANIAEYAYSDQLRCSFDPNDKKEHPDRPGEANLTLIEEDLEYKIRFQNNGNDTAFQVTIIDHLDPNIDLSSLRVINSSHPVETSIEGSTLQFLFEDILLVDSMTNFIASQGFVTFRCNAIESIAENTEVTNRAEIIFDTNPAIITNSTLNTFVSVLCVSDTVELSMDICSGEDYLGYDSTGVYTHVDPKDFGCDSTTIINLTVQEVSKTYLDFSVCEGDTIVVNDTEYIINETTQFIDTIFNDNGCITELTQVIVFTTDIVTVNIDTVICQGMDFFGFTESGIYTFDSIDVNTGCKVMYAIDLTVEDVFGLELAPIEICAPSEITILGHTYFIDSSGIFTDTIYSDIGCLDTIFIGEVILTTDEIFVDTTICEGMSFLGFSESGEYSVDSIGSDGCLDIYTVQLTVLPASDPNCTVGTEDLAYEEVKLYPNPVSDHFFIEGNSKIETVSIYNMSYQKVRALAFKNGNKEIQISTENLNSGLYFVAIESGGRVFYKKIIIE